MMKIGLVCRKKLGFRYKVRPETKTSGNVYNNMYNREITLFGPIFLFQSYISASSIHAAVSDTLITSFPKWEDLYKCSKAVLA